MTEREKILHVIDHCELEKIPVDFSAETEVINRLTSHFSIQNYDDLLKLFGVDFKYITIPGVDSKNHYVGPNYKIFSDGSWNDIWGIRWKSIKGTFCYYDEVCYSPLADITNVDDVEKYAWPNPTWFDCSKIAEECKKDKDFVRVGGSWGAIFGDSYRLQGMEKFLINMICNPEVVKRIIKKVKEFYLSLNERIFESAKGGLDIYYFGNDFGSQSGLLMSLDMWREYFKEPLKELCDSAKRFGMKVMFHSCGAIREIIPELIDIGVDILDPVQVNAKGMGPAGLKRDFGEHICFHGGIDTQNLLPYSQPIEIKENIKELIEVMGSGGGFILAPSQSIQSDVPIDNIIAMYEASRWYKMSF